MNIGSLGSLAFYITDKEVQIFTDMKWESEANYETHSLHLKKGRVELTGFSPDQVSFEMELSAFLGVNPNAALNQLDVMMANGQVNKLVIGTKVIGTNWVVNKVSRAFKHVYKDGDLVSLTVTVGLIEYV